MTPHCPKCNATALVRDDYGFGDDIEPAVRCLTCGWRIPKPRPDAPKPSVEEKTADGRFAYAMIPCTRRGCSGRVRESTPLGLCRSCSTKLKMWQYGKKTTPPPFVRNSDGDWVINPERSAA